MAATLAQIRAGLAANLATVSGKPQISAYALEKPTPPCLMVVGPAEIQYDLAMQRGLDRWTITILGLVGAVSDRGAQENLDLWLAPSGSSSIKTAIESDTTLGATVASVQAQTASGYKRYQYGGSELLGCEWQVEVNAGA